MYSYSKDKTSCLWKAAKFVSGRYVRSFDRKKGSSFSERSTNTNCVEDNVPTCLILFCWFDFCWFLLFLYTLFQRVVSHLSRNKFNTIRSFNSCLPISFTVSSKQQIIKATIQPFWCYNCVGQSWKNKTVTPHTEQRSKSITLMRFKHYRSK